jgi:hypothetical protein
MQEDCAKQKRWRVIAKNGRFWWAVFLATWVCGIWFPFEALRRYSAGYRQAFDAVFQPAAAHVLMHAFLFAVLAVALAAWFDGGRRWVAARVIGTAAAAGCLQEMIQALTSPSYDLGDGLFDLGVDVAGAVLGLVVFSLARFARLRLQSRP